MVKEPRDFVCPVALAVQVKLGKQVGAVLVKTGCMEHMMHRRLLGLSLLVHCRWGLV